MHVFYNPSHDGHRPTTFMIRGQLSKPVETPERIELLLAGVRRGSHEITEVAASTSNGPGADITLVHAPEYLDFLQSAYSEWNEGLSPPRDVLPNVHPNRHASHYSLHPVARAGMFIADMATGIGPNTWSTARDSAEVALAAGRHVLAGHQFAYALCRPPGHHACSDLAWGFCYLNNVAVLASFLLRHGLRRVAVLDIDTHHGNGTQQIFYRRSDVLTVSIHVDPTLYPPFYTGYANEIGEGEGVGFNRNVLMHHGDGDARLLSAVQEGVTAITAFGADAVIVAVGFDAHSQDPLSVLKVTTGAYHKISAILRTFSVPVISVQEGGYPGPQLADSIEAFLQGMEE